MVKSIEGSREIQQTQAGNLSVRDGVGEVVVDREEGTQAGNLLVRDGVGEVVVDREEGGFGRVVFGVSRLEGVE